LLQFLEDETLPELRPMELTTDPLGSGTSYPMGPGPGHKPWKAPKQPKCYFSSREISV